MNKNGFTLLELLVVVVIIGILASIALPQYRLAVAKSKFATLKNNVKSLYDAEQRFYLANNSWALNKNKLDINVTNTCSVSGVAENPYVSCSTTISGFYMSHIIWLQNGQKTCLTTSTENRNDITHRVCQAESKTKNPYCGDTNCQYSWK